MSKQWNQKYAPDVWPVLAFTGVCYINFNTKFNLKKVVDYLNGFTGAPASFPVQQENKILQKYLEWSDNINAEAENFIKNVLPKGAFIGIHLRNGIDWVRACEHIPQSPNLFAAPQCLGYRNEKGKATMDICLPTKDTIIRQLKRVIKSYNNAENNKANPVKSIFVASDNNHMISELKDALKRMKVDAFKYNGNNPHVDLAILGKSNFFIGNCISSYTAFVKRERDVKGFPSIFWAFPVEKFPPLTHDEL